MWSAPSFLALPPGVTSAHGQLRWLLCQDPGRGGRLSQTESPSPPLSTRDFRPVSPKRAAVSDSFQDPVHSVPFPDRALPFPGTLHARPRREAGPGSPQSCGILLTCFTFQIGAFKRMPLRCRAKTLSLTVLPISPGAVLVLWTRRASTMNE